MGFECSFEEGSFDEICYLSLAYVSIITQTYSPYLLFSLDVLFDEKVLRHSIDSYDPHPGEFESQLIHLH